MIYQFKVELKYETPSVYRILEVDSEMTFAEFHDVLQVAFGWENSHLHEFSIEKKDGELVGRIAIGMDLEGMGISSKEMFDETNEKLVDWFIQEEDYAIYTYDFGDDWRHEVVLSKIVPEEAGRVYPYCVEAIQAAPEEDSRGMMDESPVKKTDSNVLTKQINDALGASEETFDWGYLFEQARQLNKLKPWELLDDNQVFIVVDPISGENLYCSTLGAEGYEFGLAVYIGEEGLQSIKDTHEGSMSMFDLMVGQRSILLSFVDRDELEPEDYQLIKRHGLSFRGRKQWVQFRSMVPGMHPWSIDEEEARMLLLAIEQTMGMCKRVKAGFLVPVMGDEDVFAARVPSEQGASIVWIDDIIQVKETRVQIKESPLLVSELDLARLKKLERRNIAVEFDLFYAEFSIRDEEGERPYFSLMAAALDRKNGMALYQNVFDNKRIEGHAQQALLEFIEQNGFRPREIWMTSKMKGMIAPLIKPLRIEVMAVEGLKNIAQMRQYLSEME